MLHGSMYDAELLKELTNRSRSPPCACDSTATTVKRLLINKRKLKIAKIASNWCNRFNIYFNTKHIINL